MIEQEHVFTGKEIAAMDAETYDRNREKISNKRSIEATAELAAAYAMAKDHLSCFKQFGVHENVTVLAPILIPTSKYG